MTDWYTDDSDSLCTDRLISFTYMQRYIRMAGIIACIAILSVPHVQAQLVRPSRTFFVRPSFGFVNYLGDNNRNLLELGVKGQMEVGYQFTTQWGVSALYNYGEYTEVLRPSVNTGLDRSQSNTRLSNAQVLARYTIGRPTWGIAPYLHAGAGVAFGGDHPDDEAAWGPVGGAGLDIMVSPNISFFFEATYNFASPDEALDGPNRGLFADYDLLTRYSLGLSINFSRQRFISVEIYDISAPPTLNVGEVGSFVARGNMTQASDPVTYLWDFGDGATSPLLRASHSFNNPGTYTVSFQTSNGESQDIQTRTVIVMPTEEAPEIISMNSTPRNPDTRTPISFDATVQGSEPLSYSWQFEDGETYTGPFPSRIIDVPGEYQVTLTISNALGEDTKTMDVNVLRFEATYCEEIEELNAIFYSRQSSTLSDIARTTLEDNLQILLECPNISVRVEGFAVPGERAPDRLSEDRARAVEDFYVDNGVPPSRIFSIGQGLVENVGRLKDGTEQYRSAITIVLDR